MPLKPRLLFFWRVFATLQLGRLMDEGKQEVGGQEQHTNPTDH